MKIPGPWRHLTIPILAAACFGPGVQAVRAGSEPLEPGEAADVLAARTYECVVSDGHAFAATTAGLTVYDIASPHNPRPVASTYFPGSANGLALDGYLLFLALGPAGLRVLDVSEPRAPRLVAALETDGSVNAVAPLATATTGTGDEVRVVIADGPMGIKSIALRDGALRVLSSIDTGRYVVHVAARGTLAASADDDDGVGVYTVEPEGTIREIAHLATPGSARGVAFSDRRLFVAAGPAGVVAVGLVDPARPRILGSHPVGHYARGLAVSRGAIFVADSQAGLRILEEGRDAGQRPAHRLLGTFETGGSANRVSVTDTLAVVACDASGIRIVDVSDPESPRGF